MVGPVCAHKRIPRDRISVGIEELPGFRFGWSARLRYVSVVPVSLSEAADESKGFFRL
jgi:hypothetical protein